MDGEDDGQGEILADPQPIKLGGRAFDVLMALIALGRKPARDGR